MKVLFIDSHKGGEGKTPQNLHWQNANILSKELSADLIWSYPSVNDNIVSGYDIIVFNHASHYSYVDYKWLEQSPNAKLFYITNEYNLGEPRILWLAAKLGRKYTVIANHPPEPSKIVKKYTSDWINVNLNCLVYSPNKYIDKTLFDIEKRGIIYYGSFRKGRARYFNKYLHKPVVLSTHSKNVDKFNKCGITSSIISRINWAKEGIHPFKYSLYIEDETTHLHYNYLANRFYEALNYNCITLFSKECANTIVKSGYPINDNYYFSRKEYPEIIPKSWHEMALKERKEIINTLKNILK